MSNIKKMLADARTDMDKALADPRRFEILQAPRLAEERDHARTDREVLEVAQRLDPGETDIDCGGACPACPTDQGCPVAAHCPSGVCQGGSVCEAGQCYLDLHGVCAGDDDCRRIEADARREVEAAVEFARQSPEPAESVAFEDDYA